MAKKTKAQTAPSDPRSRLASVSVLLDRPEIQALIAEHSRPLVLDAINDALGQYRKELKAGESAPAAEEIVARVALCLANNERDRLRPVVNATGIILHTGLGRAVLPEHTAAALAELDRCCNLQIDLETGERGKRNYMSERLLCKLTGAEAATIVNNNAAATLLILATFCEGKEVIVSRGQLIEIGGSFRLPDCIHQSGATLVEVGTTNKTHLRDYEGALSENTGAILRVNPSNYRVVGFSKEVPTEDLVSLKEKREGLLVFDDLGCGALVDLEQYGLPHEPTVQDSVKAGADLVCFSGDKLIGGPQAGIIVGRKALIQKIKKHPLSRMLRVGKLTDLALEQTLRLFLEPEKLIERHPTIRMIASPADPLNRKAQALKRALDKPGLPLTVEVRKGASATGGGSLPAVPIDTYVVAVTSSRLSLEQLNRALRQNEPPIVARVHQDAVALDMRTLLPGEEKAIVKAFEEMMRSK